VGASDRPTIDLRGLGQLGTAASSRAPSVGCSMKWSRVNPGINPGSTLEAMRRGPENRKVVAMTTTEYALNVALVGLVLLQMRGLKITKAALVFPVVMTVWIATSLLKTIPTGGNDLSLEIGGAVAGATLGVCAGLATSVRREGATAIAKAGTLAALLWVLGIGARVGFSLWVGHGGAATIRDFSLAHRITGGPAWGTAFILMAITEVVSRTGVIYAKTRHVGATIERGGLLHRFVSA
jgi:hypothetical protein